MTATLAELQEQAKQLVAEERAQFACFLLESLESTDSSDVGHAWDVEIAARRAEIERDDVKLIPASEVFAELRRKLS